MARRYYSHYYEHYIVIVITLDIILLQTGGLQASELMLFSLYIGYYCHHRRIRLVLPWLFTGHIVACTLAIIITPPRSLLPRSFHISERAYYITYAAI